MNAGRPEWRIPFNRPWLTGQEPALLAEVAAQNHMSGDGPFTRRCHELLEQELGVARALLTTSGTHALELSALLLGISPGDEVVLPSFTFVSTANAFLLRGARPVFVDIRPDTFNLDPDHLRTVVTQQTEAVVPVHYAGVACEMDAILGVAESVGASVVEDAALALFSRQDDRYLGTRGRLAALSFHETKSFSCGEGGALLINDPSLVADAEILREKGTDRSRFFRGEVDKYTWAGVGSSYLPSDLLAAFLSAQLEARDRVREIRRTLWLRYRDGLVAWAAEQEVQLPVVPPGADPVHAMFQVVFPTDTARDRAMKHLQSQGILAVFHYLPLHLSPVGKRFGGRPGQLPVTESVSARLLRLPFHNGMTDSEVDQVVAGLLELT